MVTERPLFTSSQRRGIDYINDKLLLLAQVIGILFGASLPQIGPQIRIYSPLDNLRLMKTQVLTGIIKTCQGLPELQLCFHLLINAAFAPETIFNVRGRLPACTAGFHNTDQQAARPPHEAPHQFIGRAEEAHQTHIADKAATFGIGFHHTEIFDTPLFRLPAKGLEREGLMIHAQDPGNRRREFQTQPSQTAPPVTDQIIRLKERSQNQSQFPVKRAIVAGVFIPADLLRCPAEGQLAISASLLAAVPAKVVPALEFTDFPG